MSNKILNTVRGNGSNVIERAGRVTVKQCRERRQANRVSYCIITPPLSQSETKSESARYRNRTILWP